MIRNHIALGLRFAELVGSRSDLFKIFTPPQLALTALHVQPARFTAESEAQRKGLAVLATKRVYEAVSRSGEIYLTSSIIDDEFVIRVVAASPRVEERHLRRVFDALVECTERVLDETKL